MSNVACLLRCDWVGEDILYGAVLLWDNQIHHSILRQPLQGNYSERFHAKRHRTLRRSPLQTRQLRHTDNFEAIDEKAAIIVSSKNKIKYASEYIFNCSYSVAKKHLSNPSISYPDCCRHYLNVKRLATTSKT
jgi:hypothetical protein